MKNSTGKKKILPKVLLGLLLIICAFAVFIFINASKNMKAMNKTLDSGMNVLSESAKLTPVDPGEYKQIKMYGLMKFDVSQYDIEDIGNLSVMKVNMGFMQMVSFIITPYDKDMPMLSTDYMYILGNRKAYTEFYDLTADKSSVDYSGILDKLKDFEGRYGDLEDIQTDSAWYDDLLTVAVHKAGTADDDAEIEEMFSDAIGTYIKAAAELEKLPDEERTAKLEITQKYCDDLVKNGGVSTDVFKKQLGEGKTKDFFDKVLFGPEKYR